jgi:hypothetical protein
MINGKQQKQIISFQPPKPISGMIQQEVKGRARGAQSHLLSLAIAKFVGHKYPKLLSEFNQLYRYE